MRLLGVFFIDPRLSETLCVANSQARNSAIVASRLRLTCSKIAGCRLHSLGLYGSVEAAPSLARPACGDTSADSDEGGHRFAFDHGHHSDLMAAMLASSRGPVLVKS
jgi:hypothetical protein